MKCGPPLWPRSNAREGAGLSSDSGLVSYDRSERADSAGEAVGGYASADWMHPC